MRIHVRDARSPGASLRPFTDADEARSVGASCRTMLARHLGPVDTLDGIAVVLAAKVMDEARGEFGFEAVPGEPRLSASRFDHLTRAALSRLREATKPAPWPDIEVPELVAHEVLRDLGPYSIVLTAERPGGADLVRALFLGARGDGGGPSVLEDPVVAARLWHLVPDGSMSPALGTIAAAGAGVFARGLPGSTGPTAADLVEVRDGRSGPTPRHRSA